MQPASASEPVGKALSAKTAVYSSGPSGKRTMGANDPVFYLDRLSTNATGVGEFVFDDGTRLALGPSASLVVDQFVQKGESSFRKFGVGATKGTFRWISGRSASSAYRIKTPVGTMGVRGTAFDVTTRNGVTHVVLLNGSAKFCSASGCQVLNRSGDYISSGGKGISSKMAVQKAFKSRKDAARVFPFLANPGMLSSSFRVPGYDLLAGKVFGDSGKARPDKPQQRSARKPSPAPPAKEGEGGGGDGGKCDGGNCGAGQGGGGGNGTPNEGKGRNK